MNKFQIRKKIFKIRKQKKQKNLVLNFSSILQILKKRSIFGKIVGGYYPYNYEINILQVLKKFEKKKFFDFSTKNKKKISNGLF